MANGVVSTYPMVRINLPQGGASWYTIWLINYEATNSLY